MAFCLIELQCKVFGVIYKTFIGVSIDFLQNNRWRFIQYDRDLVSNTVFISVKGSTPERCLKQSNLLIFIYRRDSSRKIFQGNGMVHQHVIVHRLPREIQRQTPDFRLQTSESFIRQIPLFTIKQYTCTNE